MIRKYFLNFWLWWYGVRFYRLLLSIYSFWTLAFANLNILPMMANLFVPMYQDRSFSGRVISFFLRFSWVIVGLILQLLITIPLVCVVISWLSFPLVCIFQLINTLF